MDFKGEFVLLTASWCTQCPKAVANIDRVRSGNSNLPPVRVVELDSAEGEELTTKADEFPRSVPCWLRIDETGAVRTIPYRSDPANVKKVLGGTKVP